MKSVLHISSLPEGGASCAAVVDLDATYIYTDNEVDQLKNIPDASIKSANISGFIPDSDCLEELFRVLETSGKCQFEQCLPSRESGQDLSLDLKIVGFIDVMSIKDPSTGERMVVCNKPVYNLGEKQSITLPANNNDDDELIDENDLLSHEAPRGDVNSCGVDNSASGVPGKKRACKNCSCGLAEEEAAEAAAGNTTGKEVKVQTLEEKLAKSSSCGGCSRGDAFRCASCPFLGKPAFEPGQEKVVLAMTDDF